MGRTVALRQIREYKAMRVCFPYSNGATPVAREGDGSRDEVLEDTTGDPFGLQ